MTKQFKFNTCSIVLLVFVLFNNLNAQETDIAKEKIRDAVTNFFKLDRENIHLHFAKNIFLTNEHIWFKGYVFQRKQSVPFFTTTNVYAVLLDENGTKLDEKLLYANSGTFSGNFKLKDTYRTGQYYVQVYTNWMNNFEEDEASTYKISILNENQNDALPSDAVNYSKINVSFHPEGGTLVAGINNIIGIKITDCNGNPAPVNEGEIKNSAGELIKKIFFNKFGNGKFDLEPGSEEYKVHITANGNSFEYPIPQASKTGVAIEINNYVSTLKTIVKLKTNDLTLKSLNSNKVYLVIQQDEKTNIIDITFKDKTYTQDLSLLNDVFFDGINFIRIIDINNNELAQRVVFKFVKNAVESTIKVAQKTGNKFNLNGNVNAPNANLSISVLPDASLTTNKNSADFYSSLALNLYLNDKINDAKYYLNEPSRSKFYDLDLMLLNQKVSKYEWSNITNSPPKESFPFDVGLTFKGKIIDNITNKNDYKIKLYSYQSQINELTTIDEKNEFVFENLAIGDSSTVSISLLKISDLSSTEIKYYGNIINSKRTFNKIYKPEIKKCEQQKGENLGQIMIPKFNKETVLLDEIQITNTKSKLKRSSNLNNIGLRGYKASDQENSFLEVLDFIQSQGFRVDRGVDVSIFSRNRSSVQSGSPTPMVYIDDTLLMSFNDLAGVSMNDLEEIYLNPRAIIPGVNNNEGIIRIYRKRPIAGAFKSKSKSLVIQGGFTKIDDFENASYASTIDKGFQNYGLIDWIPTILTEENGDFKFQITDVGQKTVKLILEGFTADGKFISEIKTITLE